VPGARADDMLEGRLDAHVGCKMYGVGMMRCCRISPAASPVRAICDVPDDLRGHNSAFCGTVCGRGAADERARRRRRVDGTGAAGSCAGSRRVCPETAVGGRPP
jgi:hypothetical protein